MSANPPRQSIGLLQLVGQSLSIGPLVDVALFLGIVASLAGAIGPLAVLLASLGMITFSLVVAFYAVETGGTGGVGDYIERAWGTTAGVAVLGIYVLSLIFSGAGGFGIAVGELVADFTATYAGFHVPWWAGAGLLAGVAWWLNFRGAEAATQAQLIIVSVSVIPFLITAIAVVIRPEAHNTLAVFAWNHAHGGDLFAALLFCILLFGGFETVAALGEETADPRRNIPIALVGTVSLTAVILVFCSYAGTIYYGPDHVAKDWGGGGPLGGDLDPAGGSRRLHGHLHRILTGGIPRHPVARPAGAPAGGSRPHQPTRSTRRRRHGDPRGSRPVYRRRTADSA